jgi:hypothetical protein
MFRYSCIPTNETCSFDWYYLHWQRLFKIRSTSSLNAINGYLTFHLYLLTYINTSKTLDLSSHHSKEGSYHSPLNIVI